MSVYKRGDVYYVRLHYQGRDIRFAVGPDKRAAELAQKEAEKEIAFARAAGKPWTGLSKFEKQLKPKTFAEIANAYIEEREHFKASTLTSYRSILKHDLLPAFADMPLSSITSSDVRKLQARLCKSVSPSRANTVIQLLRSILRQAVFDEELEKDPSASVRRMQEPKVKIDPLDGEELARVFEHLDPHFRPIFITLAYTGARPNELQALRWSDVDWKRKTISISKGRVRGKEGLPKSASGEREVPMLEPVEAVLRELKSGPMAPLSGYVFLSKKGEPINKHLDRIWNRALRSAGVRHRPSYQLRHTFASMLLEKGLQPGYVAKLLGHANLDILFRHYARFIESGARAEEAKLRDSFAIATGTNSGTRGYLTSKA